MNEQTNNDALYALYALIDRIMPYKPTGTGDTEYKTSAELKIDLMRNLSEITVTVVTMYMLDRGFDIIHIDGVAHWVLWG